MKNENMELKTTLDENLTEKFKAVKEHMGVNSNQSVLAVLISTEYSRIQARKYRKVFIGKEVYAEAKKMAEARGKTVDMYVKELTEDMLRKAREA
jgi:hypothetical protein